jgi:hypothetical protein
MPKTMAWLMASVSMALPRRTRKLPSSAAEDCRPAPGQQDHRRDASSKKAAIMARLPPSLPPPAPLSAQRPLAARKRAWPASVSCQCGRGLGRVGDGRISPRARAGPAFRQAGAQQRVPASPPRSGSAVAMRLRHALHRRQHPPVAMRPRARRAASATPARARARSRARPARSRWRSAPPPARWRDRAPWRR